MLEFLQTLHWAAVFQIILIDILLGGDNAVVIALACRNLPRAQRMQGILWGTAGAIILRVALIAFALTLLDIPFLKIVGALLLLWIGIKLLLPEDGGHGKIAGGASVLAAVKTILVADFVMSLDNVIAIAGAAQGAHLDHQLGLVIFGLLVSVPIIIWGSTLVLKLIDRYPLVVTFGAGLLGWIAGGMLVTDVVVTDRLGPPSTALKLAVEAAGALLVVVLGRWLASRKAARAAGSAG
ncbi:TerC family protein [Castellaniella defragrans]|jgi:YjbE family integral membrane protein|uniref:Membrane protein TerC, possibly involved in tellurium resistance n=2 Tax=Castellaniella defragrans TaxID=75697 RepID=W8WZN5_CASD6|nr:TerC family protein [Castellaniella defragrans]KAB0609880.1 TerC family protein [Castellaniella defragrans]MBB6085163.1 YjbE family integral membrane protein [Castellaniella defragrans]CDM25223.1 Membrane protein TerC, possibly involved in tellurium resistance [Castellaniella defragrans 65Phen]